MTLRYVVLRHEGVPDPHFDLMFELTPGSALATWRARAWPLAHGTPCSPLPDHRAHYLSYEGAVSGGRGAVRRVACGSHTVLTDTPELLSVALDNGAVLQLPRAAHGK